MPFILGTNSIKDTGYDVANSCRFNSGDSAVLKRTHGTPTNAKKFVWSAWIKRSKLGADQYFVQNYTDGSNISMAYFRSGDDIRIFDRHGTGDGTDTVWISDAKFRDTSAWMHFLLKVDTTQSTDSDRFQVYINGSLATGNGITYPALNADMNWTAASASNRHSIAATSDGYNYVGGYLCEVVLVDGTSPAHTDFGEFDSDSPTIWKPKDVSGLTFGNNGYYLDFADSGDLGDDESGNGNDFAETNLAATDQSTDTCTNNFATLNPVVRSNNITFAEGNLKITGDGSANFSGSHGTIAVNSGKWYCEVKVTNAANLQIGALIVNSSSSGDATGTGSGGMYYYYENIYWQDNNTQIKVFNTSESGGNASVTGGSNSVNTYSTDIISMALDMDNGRIYFAKNGTYENSGNPANGTNAFVLPTNYNDGNGMTFYAGLHEAAVEMNFGSPSFSISSGNADGNGYGNFEYAVPSGYYSLNSKNLSEFG
jgi:hypothetical protein